MSGAHIAIHAAEKARKQRQEEEETMTRYQTSDLDQEWEFKIVRSTTNQFKNPDVFRQMVQEEGAAGWDLLEKLDDGRVRFKRPVAARRKDPMLSPGVDPYRTQFGISEGALAARIIAVMMLVMGGIIAIAILAENNIIF